ncbi:MAG: LemA family protein [Chitinophagales bacterium]|nr:LemA family protein [Bacteroidota bacterium]MCB9043532.1 LemA family protein [Chitinophagales bacterium]
MKQALQLSFILFLLFSLSSCGYNKMVELQEAITGQWSQVENSYQRRADLIPNLVNVVKGYADFEKSTLESVVNARAKATSINIDPTNITPEQLEAFQSAQSGLSSALSRLLVVAEQYPDLKANNNFRELQAQLEGTENRIAVERQKFNDTVKEYNTYIKKLPQSLSAGMLGFHEKAYFKAQEGAEKAPEVKF